MSPLTERLTIRLRAEAVQLLRLEAQRRGLSLAEAVRQAVDRWLEADRQPRLRAAELLFQIGAPVADWDQMKAEILDGYKPSETT